MTNEERKVLELALEALETPWNAPYVDGCDLALGKRVKAITAIKEALAQPEQDQDEVDIRSRLYQRIHELETQLAQPEQEPVAWMDEDMDCIFFDTERPEPFSFDFWKPLYTTPPQRTWVGLTEAQCGVLWKTNMTPFEYYQAIEAKLRSKNNA